ncbi:hypothetical protein PQR34_44555 [Paraburkholderia sediminicola]|uniref:hypothetical protein n=1 Tax=Paraburkholderia sediminicola TaxID=458836 RepID=UPI0038BCA78B
MEIQSGTLTNLDATVVNLIVIALICVGVLVSIFKLAQKRNDKLVSGHCLFNMRTRQPQELPSSFHGERPTPDDAVVNYNTSLPDELDYTGEFGPELVLFLPFCNWLSKMGLLKNRRIRTYRGMSCFYDDLDCLEIIEKDEQRIYVPPKNRPSWLPARDEHNFDNQGRPPQHYYPDLRAKFRNLPLLRELRNLGRPLLIIHNKHNDEWGIGPVNHISLASLDKIFQKFKTRFAIIYIRHGIEKKDANFSDDHNTPQHFDDRCLLDCHPEVYVFDDLYSLHRAEGGAHDLNTFKNILYSHCYHFISSQGGGAHHIALFSGSFLAILHRRGSEEHWAYSDGYYSFMANVPPIRVICRTEGELLSAISLLPNTSIYEDRVLLHAGSEELLTEFSPYTIGIRLS